MVAIIVTTFFYLSCGCFGYGAFGNDTPGNILTGFGFYEPYWLVAFANACIIIHLVGGYQVLTTSAISPCFITYGKSFLLIYETSLTCKENVSVTSIFCKQKHVKKKATCLLLENTLK